MITKLRKFEASVCHCRKRDPLQRGSIRAGCFQLFPSDLVPVPLIVKIVPKSHTFPLKTNIYLVGEEISSLAHFILSPMFILLTIFFTRFKIKMSIFKISIFKISKSPIQQSTFKVKEPIA